MNENELAFSGQWMMEEEKSMPFKGAKLKINFESKNVFLVINPASDAPGEVKVFLDGEVVETLGGKDVEDGIVKVDSDGLYDPVTLDEPRKHVLELELLDSNTEVYAFTFG